MCCCQLFHVAETTAHLGSHAIDNAGQENETVYQGVVINLARRRRQPAKQGQSRNRDDTGQDSEMALQGVVVISVSRRDKSTDGVVT
jgi:hypothetical protein